VFQAQLQWPTGLSLSPLDGGLHFIDDRLVLKLTDDLKVKVVAGTPLHCHVTTESNSGDHSQRSKQHTGGSNSDTISGGDTSIAKVHSFRNLTVIKGKGHPIQATKGLEGE
jgi:hypothetical protein